MSKAKTAWNKGKRKIPFITKLCEHCFTPYTRSAKKGDEQWLKQRFCSKSCKQKGNKHNLGRKHSEETLAKMRKSHPRGELSPNWNPDRTQVKSNKDRHYSAAYKDWRSSVFTRDGFKCKICCEKSPVYVEAHHILPWKEYPEHRYQINNGITLCRAHHPRTRAKEKRLAPYFQELVSVS